MSEHIVAMIHTRDELRDKTLIYGHDIIESTSKISFDHIDEGERNTAR